ncbi:MAG TPA: fibronectin type III domain-containing protein [Dermatophilaceae bacterium]|nr:fibronectin type III domain-containing protein [Dermatophilaceae bacterium]
MPSSPGGVTATSRATDSVALQWTGSTGGPEADQYLILRGAVQVGSVPSAVRTFTDTGLTPDSTYRYTVVAASGSKRSTPSAELTAHTLPAALSQPSTIGTTATGTTITWAEPTTGGTPASYIVLRDGAEVATVPGSTRSFDDTGLTPATSYRYTVVVVSQYPDTRSEPSEELVVQTPPQTPSGLAASAVTTSTLTLRWAFPAGPAPEGFVILRDGDDVGTVGGSVRAFQDKGLLPAHKYTYTVVAVFGGVRSAESPAVSATTLTPPVSAARLAGSWDVDGKITKATSGITLGDAAAAGQVFGSTWELTPRCSSGACDATLKGSLAGHSFSMTLKRSGAVYTGSNKAHVSHCVTPLGTKDVTNTLMVRLTVTKAGLDSSVWAARVVSGTLTMTSPYTVGGSSGPISYYCSSGSLTASLTGTPW